VGYAIHRSAAYWPRPLEFLPSRHLPGSALGPNQPHAYQPFGGGARMCVGYKMALQEARLCLVLLYQRLRFSLAPGQAPLATQHGLTLGPARGVLATCHLRD
jgi:cytochrome P450